MDENAPHFGVYLLVRPFGVLCPNPGGFYFASSHIERFRQLQPLFARHGPPNINLFRTGLFIRQHVQNVRRNLKTRKLLMKLDFRKD